MVNKFKVGDRVRCIDDTCIDWLTKSKEYMVSGVSSEKTELVGLGWHYSHRFELVDEIKVGDKVFYTRKSEASIEAFVADFGDEYYILTRNPNYESSHELFVMEKSRVSKTPPKQWPNVTIDGVQYVETGMGFIKLI